MDLRCDHLICLSEAVVVLACSQRRALLARQSKLLMDSPGSKRAREQSPTDEPPRPADPLRPLLAAWEAARRERDWARADALRDELRSKGVNPGARKRADHSRYDAAWAERTRELRCISTAGFLASSLGWQLSPKLQTFRGIDSAHGTSTRCRDDLARQYGRGLRAQLSSTQPEQPCVLCVEKPYLPGLIEVFEEERADDAPPPPFVLLA